jgi:dienelactone hydrolase
MLANVQLARWHIMLPLMVCFLYGCSDSDSPNGPQFDYSGPTAEHLQQVVEEWELRDLSPAGVQLLSQDNRDPGFEVRIYGYLVEDQLQYGIVSIPTADTDTPYPIVLEADGLNQSDPSFDGDRWLRRVHDKLSEAVYLVPVFRGRTLRFNGASLKAEGDFCDAYDGAVDDSIALLNVVEADVPAADSSHVMVVGGSRGGTVALLLGERDDRIVLVSSGSAPTNFYHADVRDMYSSQYKCQFLANKTVDQSRQRMLASSPIFHPMQGSVGKVYVDHGERDPVVPPWNSREIVAVLETQGVDVDYLEHPGAAHDLTLESAYMTRQQTIFEAFVQDYRNR